MADKIEVVEENLNEEGGTFFHLARRVVLSGIGAVNVAQSEVDAFVKRLVERGELKEEEGSRLLGDVTQLRSRLRPRLPIDVEQHIESLLNRMNIPSRNDILTLTEQINNLGHKLDELKQLRDK